MKTLLPIAALVFLTQFVDAKFSTARCDVRSPKFPSLARGESRDTICLETIAALQGTYGEVPKGHQLKIEVQRQHSSWLLLWVDWKTPLRSERFEGHGVLRWGPRGSWVQLIDRKLDARGDGVLLSTLQ